MEENLTKKEKRELKRKTKNEELEKNHRKTLIKRVILWSCAALVLAGSGFTAIKLGSRASIDTPSILASAVSTTDQVKGNSESKVILVEYSDFQCPACGAYYPMLKELSNNFEDKIQFVYRQFPLPSHKNARPAAYASEAAGLQGKFWEIHDMIFENQKSWSEKSNAEGDFIGYAKALNLDIEKFQNDLNANSVKEKIENDYQSGIESGVTYTPTFFLNGKKIQNPKDYDEFRSLIEETVKSDS